MIKITNWEKYQGDGKKDWTPPWFKLYHKLLDDYDFSTLPETSRFHFIGLLMLAARSGNKIRADQSYLMHQLRTSIPVDLQTFRDFGWIDGEGFQKDSGKIPEKSCVEESRVEEKRVEEIRVETPTVANATDAPENPEPVLPDPPPPPKVKRFTVPTVEEIFTYCRERKNGVNPDHFFDFYTAKGWKVGDQPMKDWKACVRTWERRDGRGPGENGVPPVGTGNPFLMLTKQLEEESRGQETDG